MSVTAKLGIVGAVLGAIMLIVVAVTAIGYKNQEVDLRTQFDMQQEKCKSYFDKMWKIIKQKAQISEKYKDSFTEVYVKMMDARYKQGSGAMMQWIKEQNPTLDSSIYKELGNTIEAQRNGYHNENVLLLDIKRQHDSLRQKFPSSLIVGSSKPLEAIVVTSGKTKESFRTGEENDVDLFDK